MTYNVFGGTLNLTQSINQLIVPAYYTRLRISCYRVDKFHSQDVVYNRGIVMYMLFQLCEEPRPATYHDTVTARGSLDLFVVGLSVCIDL